MKPKKTRIPYEGTTIPAERSKADIEMLLKTHGIKDIQWTTLKGETTLRFIHYVNVKGVEKGIIFEFRPPQIFVTKRTYNPKTNRYEKVQFVNEPVAYRLLLWYLKAKLEAVEYGLISLEKEFMSHISLALPEGTTTVGEVITKAIETGSLERLALPENPEREAIDVKATEIKEEKSP